jgi:hypothetical protein
MQGKRIMAARSGSPVCFLTNTSDCLECLVLSERQGIPVLLPLRRLLNACHNN